MARSLLLSLLLRQHMALKEKFRAKYAHPWLVWEAGAWNVPEATEQNVATTRLPLMDLRDCLPAGDAMCFELVALAERGALKLGRAAQNTFVVNDATVSREQLTLSPTPDGQWWVERVAQARPVTLDGETLEPEQPRRLQPGAKLQVGDVRLTFHDADGFNDRIARIAEKVIAQASLPPSR
ncbi:FHA domain-containing protein [Corallococcus sp. H22C18031201]|uniref:FHA domain-containing protein n=1 Tax=Citreicoccus inhibens TaxID=2849499 RepID=UPI000E721B58|nr:FHA domain-containing protein [Citreicoccus inhibens]MBJ6761532.1 FHA domain-containing protein [Myxococcaceae bacterium JPH2]MBU8898746.1 FHA domain-containing protein [Citreicoccus inhibens]RJS24119.1 FHA domain-containing protein [Corallococcus sp. H22C18031201]